MVRLTARRRWPRRERPPPFSLQVTGYTYNANERPGLNVPSSVDAVDTLQRDVCAVAGGFTNLSCVPAPEMVSVEWFLNSVDGIDDIGQTATLNMVRPNSGS